MRTGAKAGTAPPRAAAAPAARPAPSSFAAGVAAPSVNGNTHRRPGRPAKPFDLPMVLELRAQGLSLRQIARLMGVSKSSIWTAIRRLAMASSDMSNNQ
jgi:DNA-binding NarL/FixJ family response regulator